MHELSIAKNIVEIVEDEVKEKNAKFVSELNLEIGELSGIIVEALKFALDEVVKNSILDNTLINVNVVKAIAKCDKCGFEFDTNDYYSNCKKCNNIYTEIITGKELKIKSIVIDV